MKMSRRRFLKLTGAALFTSVWAGSGSLAYAREVEPGRVDVTSVRLRLPRLAPAFHGYRLVQISDIHMDEWMNGARLRAIVDLVNRQQPDLVAMTGDLVTRDAERFSGELIGALRGLVAREGVVGVLGNHDHWTDPDVIRGVLRESGVRDVSNGVHTLTRDRATLHLAGVDDYWQDQADLDRVLAHLPEDGAAILLAHEPDFADISAATGRFDLQLSGHSHGGQVIVPFAGPLIVPRYGQKYPVGRYRVGSMIQYTNRGIGMVAPLVRFNCRPEVTVFTLESNPE